jgi:hypothetical protein
MCPKQIGAVAIGAEVWQTEARRVFLNARVSNPWACICDFRSQMRSCGPCADAATFPPSGLTVRERKFRPGPGISRRTRAVARSQIRGRTFPKQPVTSHGPSGLIAVRFPETELCFDDGTVPQVEAQVVPKHCLAAASLGGYNVPS